MLLIYRLYIAVLCFIPPDTLLPEVSCLTYSFLILLLIVPDISLLLNKLLETPAEFWCWLYLPVLELSLILLSLLPATPPPPGADVTLTDDFYLLKWLLCIFVLYELFLPFLVEYWACCTFTAELFPFIIDELLF